MCLSRYMLASDPWYGTSDIWFLVTCLALNCFHLMIWNTMYSMPCIFWWCASEMCFWDKLYIDLVMYRSYQIRMWCMTCFWSWIHNILIQLYMYPYSVGVFAGACSLDQKDVSSPWLAKNGYFNGLLICLMLSVIGSAIFFQIDKVVCLPTQYDIY